MLFCIVTWLQLDMLCYYQPSDWFRIPFFCTSHVIDWEGFLRNNLYCVEWDVIYLLTY